MQITERRLTLKNGTEGPRFDPYSCKEMTVVQNGDRITFHTGLRDFLSVNNETIISRNYDKCAEKFKELTGLDERMFLRAYDRINTVTRCPECGSKSFEWVQGYPGEELLICTKCREVVGSNFNESQIM